MMLDQEAMERIAAYVDGELPAEERPQVEQVLRTDDEAKRYFDRLGELSEALVALPAEPDEPSEAQWSTLWRSIQRRVTEAAPERKPRILRLAWALPLAAAAAAAIVITLAVRSNAPRVRPPEVASVQETTATTTEILGNGDVIVLDFPEESSTIVWTVTPESSSLPLDL